MVSEPGSFESGTQGWCVRDPRFKFSSQAKMEHGMNMRMKVAVTFKGSNYLVWSRMVKTAVGSKGLWGQITTGEAPKLITQGGDQEESLVAYTGASSSRSNDDYIKRSDLDALFKMQKENGNTYGYSFGASMIAYKDDHLIRELVERTSQDPRNHATTSPEVGSPSHLDHEGGEEHEEPMQEANQDEGGVENEGEESIGSDGHGHDHGVTQTPSQDEV
ncbi:hypothetical protein IGI04_042638, partial [Brassica rapa subsp. trilocularis]